MLKRRSCAALLMVSLFSPFADTRARSPGKKRFVPLEHLPDQMLVYFSASSVTRIKDGFGKTLLGGIVTHPGTQRAIAGLRDHVTEWLERESQPFVELTGRTPFELLALLEGEVSCALRRVLPWGMPEGVLAVELGKKGDEIVSVVEKVGNAFETSSGVKLGTRSVGDQKVTVWPLPPGPLFHAVLGDHLLVVTSEELLDTIVSRYTGRADGNSLKQGVVHTELEGALPVTGREIVLEVDVPAVRTLALSALAMTPVREQIPGSLAVSGLDRVSSLGFAFGFRDGGVEGAWHLGTRGGAGGALRALQAGLPPIAGAGEALPKVPGTAREFVACRVDPGRILRDLDGLVRENFPEAGEYLDDLYGVAETEFGISVKDDVFTLGDAAFYGFNVDPPAGGLLPDELLLVKSRDFEKYWLLGRKLASACGGELKRLKWRSNRLEYLDFSCALAEEVGELLDVFKGDGGLGMAPAVLGLVGQSVIARSDLPDGWTVVANAPQAVRRYVDHYAGQSAMDGGGGLATLVREQLPGSSLAVASEGGFLLRSYNTMVSLSAGYLGSVLAHLGIDPNDLPPGEVFLQRVRPGFLRVSHTPDGFTLHGHRFLESRLGVLGAVAVIGIIAGAMLPAISSGREEAYQIACANNLKFLFTFSMMYADRGDRNFPYNPKGSVACLQQIVDAFPEDFRPKHFVCPEGDETPVAVEDGKLTLRAEGCSYEVVPWRLKITARSAILFYDNAPHHRGGRNVVFTDGAITLVDEDTFQERLEAERKRFGARER